MSTNELILKRLDSIDEKIREGTDEYLTLQQAAEYLGYKPSYMYKLTHRRLIPFYKPTNKKIYFKKSDLDAWIKRNRQKSKSEIRKISDSYISNQSLKKVRYRDKSPMKLGSE